MKIEEDLLKRLGPLVMPFERRNSAPNSSPSFVAKGEDIEFTDYIIKIAQAPGYNLDFVESVDKILAEFPFDKKYLWIIDTDGLKVIKESTINVFAGRGVVCHTNITGGKRAFQGGEIWFTATNEIVINFLSGRYGASEPSHKGAVIEFFTLLGFTVYLFPARILKKK